MFVTNLRLTGIALLVIGGFLGGLARSASAPGVPRMPFAFVENRGLAPEGVQYVGNGPEFRAWFGRHGVVEVFATQPAPAVV